MAIFEVNVMFAGCPLIFSGRDCFVQNFLWPDALPFADEYAILKNPVTDTCGRR